METYTLLSLGTLIGTIYFIFNVVSALIIRRCNSVINGFVAEKVSATEEGRNECRPRIFIPNTLARFRRVNPHHAEVSKESEAWAASLGAFSSKAQHAFNRCKFSHFACMAYPTAKKEHLRACCYFISLVFVIDEYSDVSSPSEVRKQKDIIMDALHNPHKQRSKGEWIGGEATRQFWELAIRNAGKQSRKRFIMTFDEYLEAVVQQAIDRRGRRIRDIKSYFDTRCGTVGLKPAFALLELDLDIPDEVMLYPAIQDMVLAAGDMIIIGNDITSYNVEQSLGDDGRNIVTIVMNELGTDVNGAMLWAQDAHTKLERKFLTAMETLPEWDEPLNSQVKEYCDGLGQWVRANDDWEFESKRYFGHRGLEIREKRWMDLMPKVGNRGTSEVGPVLVDSSLL